MEGDQKQWQRAALRAAHCAVPPPVAALRLGRRRGGLSGGRLEAPVDLGPPAGLRASAPLATLRDDYTLSSSFARGGTALFTGGSRSATCLYRTLCSFVAKAGRDGTEKRSAEAYRLVVAFEILCGTVRCALLEEVTAQMLMF